MNIKNLIAVAVFSVALTGSWGPGWTTCKADFELPAARYIVEVEYYQWRDDLFFWSPVLETHDRAYAELYYKTLVWAKHNGLLHVFAGYDFLGYFPVDVRMRGHHIDDLFVPEALTSPHRIAPL